ncbi:MAG: RHS repeat protein, partial [Deltaproteobacteria bacterium]|nr:RHS repeat protein [Deltaproteobacteria bacterium]
QVLDPLNGTTGFAYDANGNLLSVTDWPSVGGRGGMQLVVAKTCVITK